MKVEVDIRFRNYLINLFLKGYNGSNLEACLTRVDLASRGQFYEISGEAKLYGIVENRKIVEIANSVREELRSMSTQEKMRSISSIQLYGIKIGDHIQLKHGNFTESLLCIDENLFLVIYHNRGYLKCGTTISSFSTVWKQNEEISFIVGIEIYKTEKIDSINQVWASDLSKYIDTSHDEKSRMLFGNHKCCGDGVLLNEGFTIDSKNDTVFVINLKGDRGEFEIKESLELKNIPHVDRCVNYSDRIDPEYKLIMSGKLIKSDYRWKIVSKCEIQ